MKQPRTVQGKPGRVVWAAALMLLLCGLAAPLPAGPQRKGRDKAVVVEPPKPGQEAALVEAAQWITGSPRMQADWNYTMTARVRFLLFWVGRDDVGGGYIRRATSSSHPNLEMIQLLIGSDPAKAPRKINRWGAAFETVRHVPAGGAGGSPPAAAGGVDASAFFGFMTQAKAESSSSELEQQMSKEKEGKAFQYQAILSRQTAGGGLAKTIPFASETEFNIHTLDAARERIFAELDSKPGKMRATDPALAQKCPRARGFLASVAELVDGALERGERAKQTCYIHYGELYTLKLTKAETLKELKVEVEQKSGGALKQAYAKPLQLDFEIIPQQTGKVSRFTLLMGTQGAQRGALLQIRYQPNWWFQVILNLKPGGSRAQNLN